MQKKYLVLVSILLTVLFLAINHLTIKQTQTDNYPQKRFSYTFEVHAYIAQTARVHVVVDDELKKITLNNQNISLNTLHKHAPKLTNYHKGYVLDIILKKGINTLTIHGKNKSGSYGVKLSSKLTTTKALLALILALPALYVALLWLANTARTIDIRQTDALFWIVALAIFVRILYVFNLPYQSYQHDLNGHIQAIALYQESVPIDVGNALELPQQPLYYLCASSLMDISEAIGIDSIMVLRLFALFLSLGFLFFGYKLIKLYSKDRFIIAIYMSILGFTPSFIYLAGAINNDTLNALLGVMSIYYALRFYRKSTPKHFFLFALVSLGALLTKLSSFIFALLFIVVLFLSIWRANYPKYLTLYSLALLLAFVVILNRAYLPSIEALNFVNSAIYSNQAIKTFNIDYFFSFNFSELLAQGNAHISGDNNVRFSFLTYNYGTLFFGEYGYQNLYERIALGVVVMQLILFFGLIYLIGALLYASSWFRKGFRYRYPLFLIALNLLLIIKFLSDYPNVCNSDFRYFTPTFSAFALIIALGFKSIRKVHILRQITMASVGILVFLELSFMVMLFRIY